MEVGDRGGLSTCGVKLHGMGLALARVKDIRRLARSQKGLVRRADLKELGLSRDAIATLVRHELLFRLTPQVFAIEPAGHEERVVAAVLQAGPGAALSHGAAARRWGLPGFERAEIEVSVGPRRPVPRTTLGVARRSRVLASGEVVTLRGVATTSLPRTMVDLAARLDRGRLSECLQWAARAKLLRLPADLARFRTARLPGMGHLRRALVDHCGQPVLESWLEDRFLALIRANGFPPPATQTRVRIGPHAFRLDFAWPELRLVAEVDGYGTHSTRAEQQHDARRRTLLTVGGARVVVFTYDHIVHDPGFVVEQLRALLS